MRLLYSTTSELQVLLTERFCDSKFRLHFADEFNPKSNPPSSNPFRIYIQYREIFECNDRFDPKYIKHIAGLRRGIASRLKGTPSLPEARKTIKVSSMHGIRPVLAILDCELYLARGNSIVATSPSKGGSPTSVEYNLPDIRGPKSDDPELYLHELF